MAGRDLSIVENFMKGSSFVSREQNTHTGCPLRQFPVTSWVKSRVQAYNQWIVTWWPPNSTIIHWKFWKSGIWNRFFWVQAQPFTHRTILFRGSGQLPSLCSLNSFLNALWFLLQTSLVASWFSCRLASLWIGPYLLHPSLRAFALDLKPTEIIQDNLSFSGSVWSHLQVLSIVIWCT